MKIKVSPSLILGVLCLALVLLLGQSEQCGQHCNTTNLTNNGFGLQLSQRPSPPRPSPPRPTPPRPPPPTPIRPPPPRPPPPRPPPPTPRPPPPRPPPPPPTPSPPPPPPGTPTLAEIFPEQMFNNFIINSMHPNCPGRGFYNYRAFMTAAEAFPEFGNIGDVITRKREIAAFFGQTSHETTGPLRSAYCYRVPYAGTDWLPSFCQPSNEWPCVPGRSYYGRGPVQLKWNYNYGQAGEALRLNLLSNPDLVANDRIVSFKTAIWFWMTPQGSKPSSHEVMTGQWTPSAADIAAHRFPGYGLITNIFNGAAECGHPKASPSQLSRINFYINYCNQMGVSFGDEIDCTAQSPFEWDFTHKLTRPRPALSSS